MPRAKAAALAALANTDTPTTAPAPTVTGGVRAAGGPVKVRTLAGVVVAWVEGDTVHRVDAEPGEAITVTEAEADRLTGLGVADRL